jgi:type II secretory pathway pseudopilin PulG
MRKVLIAIVFAVVVGAIAGGFFLLGTPSEERTRRLDERRLSDLRRLQLATDLYWTRNGRLPLTLDDLAKEAGTGIYSREIRQADSHTNIA